jgi:hypothetical protein
MRMNQVVDLRGNDDRIGAHRPLSRHTPPRACAFITLTRATSWAALMAATYPSGPAPRRAM